MTNNNDEALDVVYKVSDKLEYEVDDNNIVTLLEKQDHKIQRFFRKLRFKIPEYRRTTMDEFGSFVFLQIDGKKTVREIGQALEAQFGEKVHPLYERLLLFLNTMETSFHFIEKIAQ